MISVRNFVATAHTVHGVSSMFVYALLAGASLVFVLSVYIAYNVGRQVTVRERKQIKTINHTRRMK